MDAKKLARALEPLGHGEDANGNSIDLAQIAARTGSQARKAAQRVRKGERRSRRRTRGARYVG